MKKIIPAFLLFCLACTSPSPVTYQSAYEDEFDFYNLPMGELPVGFRSELLWDDSRSFNGQDKRPVLMGLWYPAKYDERLRQIDYSDYLLADSEHDGLEKNDSTALKLKRDFRHSVKRIFGAQDSLTNHLLELPMRSFDNPEVADGKFPLVLYAASFNAGIHENSALWEMLASHGYVIATIASVGDQSPIMTADSKGVSAQNRDMNFVIDHLKGSDFIDFDNKATMGFSWGGFTSILSGIQNQAKAIISFDGSQSYFVNLLSQYEDLFEKPVNTSYMQLNQRMTQRLSVDTTAYHKLNQIHEAYLIRFNDITHTDFASTFQFYNHIAYDSIFKASQVNSYGEALDLKVKGQGYGRVCELTLLMLNAYLKNDMASKEALKNIQDDRFVWNFNNLTN